MFGVISGALKAFGIIANLVSWAYERFWSDAAKWRAVKKHLDQQDVRVEAERDRLEENTERIRREPDKTGKALESDINDTFR